MAVPGLVALLAKMHNDFGSLPFSSLTNPAIKHASEGIKFLPGERTRQLSVVEKIMKERNIIVFTSNMCLAWSMMNAIGLKDNSSPDQKHPLINGWQERYLDL